MPAVQKETNVEKSKPEMCSAKKIEDAVNVLKVLNKKFVEESLKKQPLLEDLSESPVYLQVILKRIPPPQLLRMIRVLLPQSLLVETSEVCLITGDLEKANHKAEIEPTVLHYKDLLQKLGITKVTEVIPLRQLRTEYKTYESKRQLAAGYDIFLADKKIAGVLPKTLGKSFFKDRKFPIKIDMKRPSLKDQIDKALCQTEFSLTCRGNSYALEAARLSWKSEEIAENIMACIDVLGEKIPGKWDNISGLYLKTAKSKAIPIYLSLDMSAVFIKKPRRNKKYTLDELSTVNDAKVKVFQDGRVVLKKNKKDPGSAEDTVEDDRNMNLNKSFPSDTQMESEEEFKDYAKATPKKKSKKSAYLDEVINVESENNTQESVAIKVSPKKKKGKKAAKLDEEINNAEVKNEEDTQDSFKVSSKKKRKAKKDHVGQVSDTAQMDSEGTLSAPRKASLRKKNRNFSQSGAEEDLEVASELTLSHSKKRKIQAVNATRENKQKFKKSEVAVIENHAKIEKIVESKRRKKRSKDIADALREDSSLISIEDNKVMESEKTPSKSKKNKKVKKEGPNDSTVHDSLISKGKNTNLRLKAKSSPKLIKKQKNVKKINAPQRAK